MCQTSTWPDCRWHRVNVLCMPISTFCGVGQTITCLSWKWMNILVETSNATLNSRQRTLAHVRPFTYLLCWRETRIYFHFFNCAVNHWFVWRVCTWCWQTHTQFHVAIERHFHTSIVRNMWYRSDTWNKCGIGWDEVSGTCMHGIRDEREIRMTFNSQLLTNILHIV